MDQRIAKMVEFKNLQQAKNSVSAEFLVDKRLPSFEGHFPNDPILPAVSVIDISLYLLSQGELAVSHGNIQVKRSKFMAKVRPEQTVEISGTSPDGQNWHLTWMLKEDQSKLAQVHLVL